MRDELHSQQVATLAKHQEQLRANLQDQREAAARELWDLDSRARKVLYEELEELTEELERATIRLDE